jgi:hypothetical protein
MPRKREPASADESRRLLEAALARHAELFREGKVEEASRQLAIASRLVSEALEETLRQVSQVMGRIDRMGGRSASGP